MESNKKLFIKTYGCQMNVYDSEKMATLMKPLGFKVVESPDEADMVVLNTCHIREKATEKVYSELGRIRAHKEAKKDKGEKVVIAVAGCVGQAEGEAIFERAPFVDIVVGPQSYQHLPELVVRSLREGGHRFNLEFPLNAKFDSLPEESEPQSSAAFLSVQEGCDKFCTFCVVSYTRGAEFSRPVNAVYREALGLVSKGVVEITLLGQNVNAYHGEGPNGEVWSLAQLIHLLATIDGLKRIRYTTSHPMDMTPDLIRAHAEVPQLMPFLHLPIQAGSDRILKAMNRKHKGEEYVRVIKALREARPDIAFSSDFIVGFPGETEEDFQATLRMVEEVYYAQAYSFKYSPRPGTPGAVMENQVPEDVKAERLERLQALLNAQQLAFNQKMIGKTVDVLFDRQAKYPGQLVGRSPYMQSVHVHQSTDYLGKIVPVTIHQAFANSLAGEISERSALLACSEVYEHTCEKSPNA